MRASNAAFGAHQRFQRHGAGHVGQPREPAGVEHGQHAQPRHEMRAVEQGQSFLGLERQRPHTGGLQRLSGGHSPPVGHRLALADEAGGHVSERGQVTRRSHRSLLGDDGMHRTVQARHQGLDHARPDAGGAARQRRGQQEHQRAGLGLGQRGTDTPGVAQHQIALQRRPLGRRNHHVLELADPGGDAVDRLGAAGQAIDERSAVGQPLGDARRQGDLATPARHVLDVAEPERAAVQDQRAQIAQPFVSAATRATTSSSEIAVSRPPSTTRRPWTHTSVTACGDMA